MVSNYWVGVGAVTGFVGLLGVCRYSVFSVSGFTEKAGVEWSFFALTGSDFSLAYRTDYCWTSADVFLL